MKRICAWCRKELGSAEATARLDACITHGICDECSAKIFEPKKTSLINFLDNLGAPVIVVDSNGNVASANTQAQQFLHKTLPELAGPPGDIFECAFARYTEGCGNTVHCNGCAIRAAVLDTFHSGNSHLKTPVTLKRGTLEESRNIQFLISTEKVNNLVLLRIDHVENR